MDPLRVLLVDDDALVRTAISRVLRRLGCVVVVVATFGEAVDALGASAFEVVIADYNLSSGPSEDGEAVLEHAKEDQPQCHRALCTGNAPPHVERLIASGLIATLLLKPVTLADIEALVATVRTT